MCSVLSMKSMYFKYILVFLFFTTVQPECLGYVRNTRSLMDATETLCRDDIRGLTWEPESSLIKRKRQ